MDERKVVGKIEFLGSRHRLTDNITVTVLGNRDVIGFYCRREKT